MILLISIALHLCSIAAQSPKSCKCSCFHEANHFLPLRRRLFPRARVQTHFRQLATTQYSWKPHHVILSRCEELPPLLRPELRARIPNALAPRRIVDRSHDFDIITKPNSIALPLFSNAAHQPQSPLFDSRGFMFS